MWHRLLLFLHIRNEFDWAPNSLGPDVPHPYYQHETLKCCEHCGGGRLHAIHRQPWDTRRTQEVVALNEAKVRPALDALQAGPAADLPSAIFHGGSPKGF